MKPKDSLTLVGIPVEEMEYVNVWNDDEGVRALQSREDSMARELQASLPNGGAAFGDVYHSLLDLMMHEKEDGYVKMTMETLALFSEVQPQPGRAQLTPDDEFIESVTSCLKTARAWDSARRARHDVMNGLSAVVTSREVDLDELLGNQLLGDIHTADYQEQHWRRIKNVHFGMINQDLPGYEEMLDAMRTAEWKASVPGYAQRVGAHTLSLMNQVNWQAAKASAPSLTKFLAKNTAHADQLAGLLGALLDWAKDSRHRCFGDDGGAARIGAKTCDAWCERHKLRKALKLIAKRKLTNKGAPVLYRADGRFYFAPGLARHIAYLVNHKQKIKGRLGPDRAAHAMAHAVRKALEDTGWVTGIGRMPLQEVEISRKHPSELDALAVRGTELLCIECKANGAPPGAWRSDNEKKRARELDEELEKLECKRQAWTACVWGGEPFRVGGQVRGTWSGAFGNVRDVTAVLVSLRVEPRIPSPPVPAVTFAPPVPARILQEHLPPDRTMPVWNAVEEIPRPRFP